MVLLLVRHHDVRAEESCAECTRHRWPEYEASVGPRVCITALTRLSACPCVGACLRRPDRFHEQTGRSQRYTSIRWHSFRHFFIERVFFANARLTGGRFGVIYHRRSCIRNRLPLHIREAIAFLWTHIDYFAQSHIQGAHQAFCYVASGRNSYAAAPNIRKAWL